MSEMNEMNQTDKTDRIQEVRIGLRHAGQIDPFDIDDYIAAGGYQGFQKALEVLPETVIEEIMASGLRGRGGGGFPTGLKWQFTRAAEGQTKYVCCNADEGEPGTFKDREIMERDPHAVLEGMMIAAYALGASTAYIYIRAEYGASIRAIRAALASARARGLLGKKILSTPFSLDIRIRIGGGSYLAGEESALIESIEGKRAYPRIKPPYPAQRGIFNAPTLVNNVETLAHVPEIIRNGAEWYRAMGTPRSPGTKIFAICGDVQIPGCYETEMGIPLNRLLDLAGGIRDGKALKTVLVGGAAGTFIPPDAIDIPMDFESLSANGFLLGSGAIIVLAQDRSLSDFLQELIRFFAHESCGKCVPCRVGCIQLLERLRSGPTRLEPIIDLAELMTQTSLCPLGQSPLLPIRTAARYFESELLHPLKGESQ
ncbi:MAG: complex I 51 kDa subunit family protein [Candidatus Omnitrophota bacterium]